MLVEYAQTLGIYCWIIILLELESFASLFVTEIFPSVNKNKTISPSNHVQRLTKPQKRKITNKLESLNFTKKKKGYWDLQSSHHDIWLDFGLKTSSMIWSTIFIRLTILILFSQLKQTLLHIPFVAWILERHWVSVAAARTPFHDLPNYPTTVLVKNNLLLQLSRLRKSGRNFR